MVYIVSNQQMYRCARVNDYEIMQYLLPDLKTKERGTTIIFLSMGEEEPAHFCDVFYLRY